VYGNHSSCVCEPARPRQHHVWAHATTGGAPTMGIPSETALASHIPACIFMMVLHAAVLWTCVRTCLLAYTTGLHDLTEHDSTQYTHNHLTQIVTQELILIVFTTRNREIGFKLYHEKCWQLSSAVALLKPTFCSFAGWVVELPACHATPVPDKPVWYSIVSLGRASC
jgi:hypothetical protein